jgi:hypothetical protein
LSVEGLQQNSRLETKHLDEGRIIAGDRRDQHVAHLWDRAPIAVRSSGQSHLSIVRCSNSDVLASKPFSRQQARSRRNASATNVFRRVARLLQYYCGKPTQLSL